MSENKSDLELLKQYYDAAEGPDYTSHLMYDKELKKFLTPQVMTELESQLASLGKCPNCKKKFDNSIESESLTVWYCKSCNRLYLTENDN